MLRASHILAASTILNISLLSITGHSILTKSLSSASNPGSTSEVRRDAFREPKISETAKPSVDVRPFQWSEVESVDLATYVSNLRAIGCPEDVIHAIIEPRAAQIFAARRGRIRATPEAAVSPSAFTALNQLQNEEAAFVRELFQAPKAGDVPVTSTESTQAGDFGSVVANRQAGAAIDAVASADSHPSPAVPPVPVSTPASLLDPSPDLKFTPQQLAQLESLRQEFVNDVGGTNQDPNDPAYLQRWREAQPANDGRFKMLFGWQAFVQQQLSAMRQTGDLAGS